MPRLLASNLMAFSLLLATAAWGEEINLQAHSIGIWSIHGAKNDFRWIVIHNLADGARTGIYHIEVLSRRKGDPVWKLKHLANHLAISEPALKRSIVHPLKSGAVYPESFDYALKAWQAENNGAGGQVCETEVVRCLAP